MADARKRRAYDGVAKAVPLVLALALVLTPPATAVVEVTVTDGSIVQMTASPSSSDPGPIVHSLSDALTFSCGATDEKAVMSVELVLATSPSGGQTATVQGTTHTLADWYYGTQSSTGDFLDLNVTGAYDADAASYTVPAGFTDSQGTLTFTRYANADPAAGATSLVRYWAYDATNGRYQVGSSKDLTATGDLVHPVAAAPSGAVEADMETTVSEIPFLITAVGSGAAGYLPTLTQGDFMPATGGCTEEWFMLLDLPAGAASGSYGFTLRATGQALGV